MNPAKVLDNDKPVEPRPQDTMVTTTNPAAETGLNPGILATAKGGGIIFVGKVFTYGTRFATTVVLARLLGAEQYGIYNLALSAAAIAGSLALIGLDSALVRYVALWRSRRDDNAVWGTIQVGLGLSMLLSVLCGVGLFGLSYLIAGQVFHAPALAPILQLSSVIVPFLTLSDTLAGATRGFKTMQYMVIAQNFVQPLVRMALILLFAIVGLNAPIAILTYGLADLSASVVLFYYLNRQFSLRRPLTTGRREVREMMGFAVPIWISDSMSTFRINIQSVLLGSLNTVTTVGIFAVASQMNLVADLVQTSVTTAVRPIIVEVHDQRQFAQLGQLYQTVSKWMFAFNLPVFLVVVMFPSQILSLFGKTFEQGALALTILAWASLVDAFTGMCGAVIDYTGYPRLKLVNSLIRLVLSIGMNLWLIPIWGMVGAAVAALVNEIVINALRIVEVYVLFRILPYDKSFIYPIGSALAAIALTVGVGRFLPGLRPLPLFLVQVTALLAVYVALVGRLGLSLEDRKILEHLRKRAGRRVSKLLPAAS